MLYQEYQQKIEKLAKIRKFLFRYRVLFILLTAAILSLTITLMAITGTVTDTSCPSSFTYGDNIDYSAGAIMGDVSYEYSVDGVNWTNVQPTEVGTYKVRAVSRGLFGTKRTGDVHEFTIEPQTTVVRIVENSVVYGDIPTVTAQLSYNDKITCTEFDFIDPTADSTTVVPRKDKIVITNEEGVDVTDSYNLQVDSSTLTIDKRPITITVSNQSAVYSDTTFTYKEYEVSSGTIAKENGFSDQVQASFSKSLINVGETVNNATFSIINSKGKDVTNKYQITAIIGTIKVTHRPIKIISNPLNIDYDGLDHDQKGFTIAGGSLANGHSLVVTASTIVNNANGEGVENIQAYKILDAKNNDVTDNYNIDTTDHNLLIVKKRAITIKSADKQLIYNDKPQSDKSTSIISDFKLVNDDFVNVIMAKSLQYVSSAENVIECRILTKDNSDNTDNYEISYDFGTLEIIQRQVSINTNSHTFTYNGNEQYDLGYTKQSELDFVDGHTIAYDTWPTIKTVSQTGTSNNYTFHINDNQGTDVTSNYLIRFNSYGTLSMVPRNISIESNSSTHIYDSLDHHDTTYQITNQDANEGLVNGETIIISLYETINEVGEKNNIFPKLGILIYSGANEVTENYNIDLSKYGILTVVARKITFKPKDISKTYDGTPLTIENSAYTITNTDPDEGLAPENLSILSISGSMTDYADESGISTITAVNIFKGSKNVTNNYDITKQTGSITIFRRAITIETDTPDPFIYDAELHSSKLYTVTSKNKIVDGQLLDVETSTEVIDVLYDNKDNIIATPNEFISYKILKDSIDKTFNYDITITPGELKVLPRALTITANSDEKVYDGTPLSILNTDYKVGFTSDNLVSTHTAQAKVTGSIINVFDVNNASIPSDAKILTSSNDDVTKNYNITYANGTLTITQKALSIETITPTSKVYDGTPLKGTYTATGLCGDYDEILDTNIKLTELTIAKENVTLEVESILITKKEGGLESTGNYLISYTNGTLTVTKRPISIKSNSSSRTYNAEEYFDITFTITNTNANEGLVAGETVNVVEYETITNVGTADNIFTTIQIFKDTTETTDNYTIDNSSYGTIEVTKRNITIKAKDLSKVYDGTALDSTNDDFIVTNTDENEGLVDSEFNHYIVCSISGEMTEYSDTPAVSTLNSATIYDANDDDMANNYNITLENGTITINKREITVSTEDKGFTYNAEAHTWAEFSITSTLKLVDGHTFIVLSSTSVIDVIYNADEISFVDNEFTSYKIEDSKHNDKTFNYEVSFEKGKLTVNPASLTITADSKDKVYDGTALALSDSEFTSSGLISPHTITIKIAGTITDVYLVDDVVSTIPSIPSDAKILDASSNDVTKNYAIAYVNGELKVTPKPITITTTGGSKVYDGTPLNGTYSVDGLCDSYDEIQSVNIKLTELTNFGNVELKVEAIKITKLVGHNDSTTNYTISYVTGYLEVEKRTVQINTNSNSKEYDGTPLIDKTYTLTSSAGYYDIAANQTLTIVASSSIINKGTTKNTFDEITIIDASEQSVISNYDVSYIEGDLTINARAITITAHDYTTEYNGLAQSQTDKSAHSITSGSLADNQTIKEDSISFTGSQTIIGVYANEIGIVKENIIILNASSEEVHENYDITIVKGTLTITKRQISIVTESKSFIYDGTAHKHEGYSIVEGSLLSGHTLSVVSSPSVTTVADGIVDNIITFSMDSAYGDNYEITVLNEIRYSQLTNSAEFNSEINYYKYDSANTKYVLENNVTEENFADKCEAGLYIAIDYRYGKLSIIPFEITITTKDGEWTYDGEAHKNDAYTTSDISLLTTLGHEIIVTSYTTIKDVYYEDNKVSSMKNIIVVKIQDSSKIDQTSNYNIIYVTGSLTINPLAITITTDSLEKVYDGTALDGTYQPVTGLATNDYSSITCPSLTDAKIIKNAAEIELYRLDTDGITHISVLGNYLITKVEGTLTITKRPITFTIQSGNWTYDGEMHESKSYEIATATTDSGLLVSIHKVLLNDYAKLRNVDSIANFITPEIVEIADETNIVTSNYQIIVNKDATLTITKANLTITVKDTEFIYDGNVKSSTDVSTQGLATSDYLIVETSASAIVPGKYVNEITSYNILTSSADDASSNYNILIANGTLTIKNRPITIESEECHEIYQAGKEYKHNVVNITSETKLISGHKLVTDTITLTGKYTDGTPNKILSYAIVDENNDTIKYTDYYDVTKVENLFYIGNPYIYIASPTVEAFYDEKTELQSLEENFIIDKKLLISGHTIKITNIAKLTGIGSIKNTFDIDIVDGNGDSVLSQYEIKKEIGQLTIRKRKIIITTGGGEWIYDGAAHSNDFISVDTSEIKEGYKLDYTNPTVTITKPGTVYNTITYSIKLDDTPISASDLSTYYDTESVVFGKLTVKGRPITVQTASDEAVYDSENPSFVLKNSNVVILDSSYLLEGHTIQDTILTAANGECTGSATETVKVPNTIDLTKFVILDASSNDVTEYYELDIRKGTLTIYSTKSEEEKDNAQTRITILSTKEDRIYLKTFVCGSYTGSGSLPFNLAAASDIKIDGNKYSADYITSLILKEYEKTLQTATITNYLDSYYPLPYYMDLIGTYTKQTSDALYAGDKTVTPYTVYYYSITIDELREIIANGSKLSSSLQTEEQAYYSEISKSGSQYMTIDSDTKAYMDTIIDKNDLDNNSLSVYQKIVSVASYIQSSAEYSTSYNEKLDSETNVAIAFLDKYKMGVCRHFATAATMLYRALGIPARLVVGYVANVTKANEPIDVTNETYHAWVEVYVSGYGWIQIEVTGGGNVGGYNATGETKEEITTPDALTLTLRPVETTAEYDGDVHTAEKIELVGSEEYDGISALEALGYRFEYTLSGSGTTPGDYTSSILTLHIYKGDTDITEACSITKQTNEIHITKASVTIKSSDGYWIYDGQVHEKNSYKITNGEIVEGDQEYVSCTTKIKDIGSLDNDFTYVILNSSGEDVTSYYEVTKEYGKLEVSKIGITITTNSASRPYNGEPLTNTEWSKDVNLIVGELLPEHEIYVTVTGTITDPGSTKNTATYIIKDGDNDVTNIYYIIDFKPGILTVEAKEVTVKTTGHKKIYDGEPINGADFTTASWDGTIDTTLYNVTLTITGATIGANAQEVDNTCTISITEISSGKDVTSEYTISYDLGKLTIDKRLFYVKTGSKSIYYDGVTTLSCPEYTTVNGLLNDTHTNTIYTAQNWSTLTVIPDDAVLTTNSKGEKIYRIKNKAQFVIVDENNNDVSENYQLKEDNLGYLTLIMKQISLTSGNASKEYDGEELRLEKDKDTSFKLDDSAIFEGHTVIATQTGTITNVGSTENTYSIKVEDALGNDVTKIYDITTSFGVLTVTKRQVNIDTGSASKKYDGTPLTCDTYYLLNEDSVLTSLGHVLVINVTGSTIDKTVKNTADGYVYKLVEGEEVRLDDIYDINFVFGTLEIITRDLIISSNGATKVYDGTPLRNKGEDQITVLGTANIEPGHKLNTYIADSVAITTVGQLRNTVTYSVTDIETGEDVTYLYNINDNGSDTYFGYLVVTEKIITIKTGSKKSSDTTVPVTYNYYEILDGEFYDDYTITITGSQAEIGSSNNTFEFTCDNKDCYSFIEYLGELTMYDSTDPDNYAQIYSETAGTIILKETSYGEYTKTSWSSATPYSIKLDDKYSMSYLNGISLSGLTPIEIRILAYYAYALPYFLAMDGNSIQTSDTAFSGNISSEYLTSFYMINVLDNIAALPINLGDYSDEELAYRNYVYANYLAIPASTRTELLSRLNLTSLDASSSTYINDIIQLIKNCGTNDSNYSKAIDASSDLAISFLDYKKGISKHFATLGTLVFRLLGIPARYTVGAIGEIEANKWSSISSDNRLSYVEIYIDGFGWVPVNVTPESGVTPPQEDDDDEKTSFSITPVLTEASYTGNSITPTQKLDETEETLAKLLAEGYTYEVTIATDEVAKTDNGTSTIERFILKDKNGIVVYDSAATAEELKNYDFEILFNEGTVKITNVQIKVYLTNVKTVYDGTAHGYGTSDVYYYFNILSSDLTKSDFVVLFDKSDISLTKAGSVDYDVLRSVATVLKKATAYKSGTTYYTSTGTVVGTITDETTFTAAGTVYTNVTNSFYLVFVGKGLVVEQNTITITSGSSTKAFDGSTLTCDTYTITLGTLASGDTIKVTITGSLTDKGTAKNTIESVFVENSAKEDVTDCYKITCVEGDLTITD